jgi:hypothetical protein
MEKCSHTGSFLNKGAIKLYFVLRSQDSSQDFSYELIYTCSMFDFHDANDRQYFE